MPLNEEPWDWSGPVGCCFIASTLSIHPVDQIALHSILRQKTSCRWNRFDPWNVWWSMAVEIATLWKTKKKTFVQRMCVQQVWRRDVSRPSVSAFTSLIARLYWPDRPRVQKTPWAMVAPVGRNVAGQGVWSYVSNVPRLSVHANGKKKTTKKQRKGKCGPSCN